MTDRDRLAADLAANPAPWNEETNPKEPGWITATADYGAQADRLIALGWTRLDRIGACECSICDDRGLPCPNHSDICANCHRDCWGSVYPLDEERLARAFRRVMWGEPNPGPPSAADRDTAAAIAKAYREDKG